jgi:K+-sensing histidine kinase KdpD
MGNAPSLRSALIGTVTGGAVAVVAVLLLLPHRSSMSSATPALVLLLPGVVAAVLGGRLASAAVALSASFTFGVLFLPPLGRFKILSAEDVVAAFVFLVVAVGIAELTARERDRRRQAETRTAEVEQMTADLARSMETQADMERQLGAMAVMAEVDEQRSALLRSVSHDLRTPLATIRAVATDLRSAVSYDDATRADLLGLVSDEAERLDRLVANLLSMSRIEAGALTPDRQAIDLPELLATSAQRMRRALDHRRLERDVPADLPLVEADYTQIDQVVTNLLENAARHSPQRSTIRLGARVGPTAELVQVWVENSGSGVLPTERERIFEVFHRSAGSRSSGVGLAICKAVVEAHGGTIAVSDVAGGGARFTFTLPARTPPVTGSGPAAPRSWGAAR